MEIIYSPNFAREYKKLSLQIKKSAEKSEILFRMNPFDPTLKTHKLKGHLKGLWAFSIDFKHRIIFEFVNKDEVHFHSVGDHGIYK